MEAVEEEIVIDDIVYPEEAIPEEPPVEEPVKTEKTMKFLLVSRNQDTAFIGDLIQQDGHSAKLFSPPGTFTVIPSVSSPQDVLDYDPDIILSEAPGAGHLLTQLGENVKIFGGGPIHDQIEHNPAWVTVMAAGIRYIVSDTDVGGPTFYVVGVATGEGFSAPAFVVHSLAKLSPSIGFHTPEVCVLEKVSREDEIFKQTFAKLEPLFQSWKYKGFVTLRVQLTPQMEYHTRSVHTVVPEGFMAAFAEGLSKGIWYFLKGAAGYKLRRRLHQYDFRTQMAISVKLTLPPYPYTRTWEWLPEEAGEDKQKVAYWLNQSTLGHRFASEGQNKVYWSQVTRDEESYVTTGPHIGYVSDCADDPTHLMFAVSDRLHRLTIPGVQYRTSILDGFVPYLETVSTWKEVCIRG